jgi:hypothetical protein
MQALCLSRVDFGCPAYARSTVGAIGRIVAVGALFGLFAGCGGANDPDIAAALARTEEAGSSRIHVTATQIMDGKRATTLCSGRADHERLELRCRYTEGDLDVIAIDDVTFVRGTLRLDLGLPPGYWAKVAEASYAPVFSPQGLLADLRPSSREIETVGQDQVRGVATTRYRFVASCGEVDVILCEGTSTAIDVSIDDAGYVRRVEFTEESGASGEVQYYDFGIAPPIEPPAADRVIEVDASG